MIDVAFGLAAALATIANHLYPGHVAVALKLLPMGLLIARLAAAIRRDEVEREMGTRILVGFVLSTIGDVVIAYVFAGGIAAFLLAHVAYLAAMGKPRGALAHVVASIPAVAVGGTMTLLLLVQGRAPEPLRAPVALYILVISTMLARATGRAIAERTRASWLLCAGAAIFVTSDALIAVSRWIAQVPYPRILILATYYVAQRLILAGVESRRPA